MTRSERVDKVTLDIQWRHQAINWVRATPAEATAEDVAAELYGSETFAYLITPAAPLFGFRTDADGIRHLKPTYREQLQRIQGNPDYHGSHVPERGRPDDPANQVIGGPLGDEAAKRQAQGIKPTPNITKAGIVERLRAIVDEFAWLQQSAKPWGQEALLDAAKHKVDQRSRELASTSDPAAGADWDAQSQVQLEVVQTARNAVRVAAEQEKTFQSFPSARWLIVNLVRDYVEAAAVSDLGATARAKLAAAEQRSRMFPADLMEALLETVRPVIQSAKINKTRLDGHAGEQNDARYGAGAMEKKELELRQGLAKVRDLLMEHPEKAKPELDRLLKEVTTLSTEVTLVSNMDSCDAAWAALDASLSKVGTAVSWVSSEHGNAPLKRDMAAVATLRMQWRGIYDTWKAAKTPEEKKAAENELSLKAKSKEWTGLFEAIRKDIGDHETYDKWVTFGAMVGIAIITGGLGVYVEAAAGAAWGTAAGFAASTAAETATFTLLSEALLQKDPSLATFFNEFESNILMFGGLKAVGKVWGVAGKALELEHDQIAASSVLVEFIALNGAALAEADQAKRKHTGGVGLTGDEIASISFHNLAFLVAVSIGQWVAKPFLVHLEAEGRLQGALLAARAAGEKVEALANQVAVAKGKDPAKARQLNHALADALAKREAVLAVLGEPVMLNKAGGDSTLKESQHERPPGAVGHEGPPPRTVAEATPPHRVAEVTASRRVAEALAANHEPAIADIVELRRGLADGIVKAEMLPKAVRQKVFQGWKDVPPSLHEVAEHTNFSRVRAGTPGVIRPESELSNADVADSMNTQLQKVKAGQVDDLVNKFPKAQREHARQVLARASGFGQMESMNSLRAALEPHLQYGRLYTPGSGSLADNLVYLSTKQTFKANPGKIETSNRIGIDTVVILDDVVLAQIKSDKVFAQSLNQSDVVLLRPRGFNDGINMFDATLHQIEQRVGKLLDRVLQIEKSGRAKTLDDAITQALDEATDHVLKDAKVKGHVETVDPAAHADVSNEGIAKQLNGDAGITAEQIRAVLQQLPEADQAMIREMMAQQAEIFSPRRIAAELAAHHAKILGEAGVPRDKIYFLIPHGNKSYGMLAMAHREATGTPVEHYINGTADLAARKLESNTMVVIFDDVAGSLQSLKEASMAVAGVGYRGKLVVAPMVSTSVAKQRFTGPDGVISQNRRATYDPSRIVSALADSPMFKGLAEPQQRRLVDILHGLGWGQNALSMAFPYMAPDNNNQLFASKFAQEFIVNKNTDAAKKHSVPWKPPSPSPL